VDVPQRPALTGSEARVLGALTAHQTTAALAAALHVSPNTIKTQLKSLYRKLGCSNRDDAVNVAIRLHLITPDG
jgi:DNA-binding CsgD family transcriptional regulator